MEKGVITWFYPALSKRLVEGISSPFGEHLATARHRVPEGRCRSWGVYETRLRINVYETRRGDEFRKLETSHFPGTR